MAANDRLTIHFPCEGSVVGGVGPASQRRPLLFIAAHASIILDCAAMSKPMRAKMRINSITKTGYSEIIEMQAVYGGSTNAEDNTYASATPSGSVKLQIDNKALHGVYQPEDTFYVDFTPIPKA